MIHRVILIRHGETVDNARGIAQGWSDSALSERGQQQVGLVAQRLQSIGLTHLVSSPLPRALTTAQAIAEQVDLDLVVLDDFREMNCGDWEGLSFELVRKNDPEFHRVWSSDPSVACPNGESFEHVLVRVRRGLIRVQQILDGGASKATVGIVSHGTAIRIAATEMLGLPLSFARQFAQDNTAVNIFEWRGDRYVLKAWNDSSHCNGADL